VRKLHEIQKGLMDALDSIENGQPWDKSIEGEAEEKLVNYYHAIHSIQGDILEAEAAIKTAQEFKKRKEAAVEWLEARVVETLQLLGKKKLDRPDCRITVVDGRVTLARVDPSKLPVYLTSTTTPAPVVTADWKAVEIEAKARLEPVVAEAVSLAKLEGGDVAAAEKAAMESFQFYGCKFVTGKPSLRYPKLKAGDAGKEE
jgi:hypothetical protein